MTHRTLLQILVQLMVLKKRAFFNGIVDEWNGLPIMFDN